MKRIASVTLILTFLATPAFAQVVRATWYGNELRGHRTASGEAFKSRRHDRRTQVIALRHLSRDWQSSDRTQGCGSSE